jgi:outer membrane protein assembly factor BamB
VATTRSGRVVKLDAATGKVAAAAQLPLPCRVSPVVAASGSHIYQLADHSHVFALSAADLSCAGVVYVGHEPASVVTPPLVVGQHLVIADNSGAADATLQVLGLKEDGLPQGVVQRVSVPGLVLTPPIVVGQHLVVITDRGDNVALRLTSEKSTPLERLNEAGASAAHSLIRYGMPLGEKLVVAGDGLRLDALDPASGSFQPIWTAFAGEALLGPPQQAGDVLFCVRRDATGVGAVAAAVQATTGKPLWQTRIAVPLATGPLVDAGGQSATLVTIQGNVKKIDLAGWRGDLLPAMQESSILGPLPSPPLADCLLLPGGDVVAAPMSGASALLIVPAATTEPRSVPLPGTLAAPPVAFGGGVLVACSSGDVVLLNPADGAPQADPLQIPFVPGQTLSRGSLGAAGENADVAVHGDGQLTLRQIGLETAPQARLVEQATVKLASRMISPVALLGKSSLVVDQGGELRSFALPGLAPGPSFKLDAGAIVLGPLRVGSRVLVATDRDELWCFDTEPKQLWKVPLTHGPLAGSPVDAAGSLIVVTKTGALCRLDAETGKEMAVLELGQGLNGTPAVSGQFVLVPAADGTLLKVTLPAQGAANP